MKALPRRPRRRRKFTFMLALALCGFLALIFSATQPSTAIVTPAAQPIPKEVDVRGAHGVPKGTAQRVPTKAQLKALNTLQSAVGQQLQTQYNGLTATPRHILAPDGYLTPPSDGNPEKIARQFLSERSGIFRFSDTDLENLRLKSRAVVPDLGTTILLFEQQVNGLPVYHGEVLVNVNRSGQIIDVGSESFPQLQVSNSYSLTAAQAITAAATELGIQDVTLSSKGKTQVLNTFGDLEPQFITGEKFTSGGVFTDEIVATRTVFPLGDEGRQAYKFVLTTPQFSGIMWQVIVDAETGKVLRRISLTSFVGPKGGGQGTGRLPTFRPDIQDRLEAQNPAGTATAKVFDSSPTALSGRLGVGRSPARGTPPTYPPESTTAANSGRGFRFSFVSARNESPLVYNVPFGQVLRGLPDANNPSVESPFGWFYLPTEPQAQEVTTPNNNRATTRAFGYTMADEARLRNDPSNSPVPDKSQPFSASLTPLATAVTLGDGRQLGAVFQSNYTEGNNVLVADDHQNDNETTHGIRGYNPSRLFTSSLFDFTNSYEFGGVDAASGVFPPSTFPDVYPGTTTLFYYNNVMHDYMYSIGFTEPLWNFQQDNFGKGGAGKDGVSAQVQDGSGVNNANFGTPDDGGTPRMQMFLFTEASFRRSDGDFDFDVVAHEWHHGVSNRSVAKGASGCLGVTLVGESGGQGEGWSDYIASSMVDDDAEGEYVTGEFDVGIRRLPVTNYRWSYASINGGALNRRDQQPPDANPGGVPFEVHDVGEVWSAVLWDMRELIIMKDPNAIFFDGTRRLGSGTSFYIGSRQVQSIDTKHPIDYRATFNTNDPATINASQHIVRPGQLAAEIASLNGARNGPLATAISKGAKLSDKLVLRGMQLSICNPSFIDSRDSILLADREMTGGENRAIIWRAFASHGVGANAVSTNSGTADPGSQGAAVVVEDFTVPAGVTQCEQLGPLAAPPFTLSNPTNNTARITINGGTPIAGAAQYIISRATSAAGPFVTIATIPASQTVYNDNDNGNGLVLGQTYFYQVRASRDAAADCVSGALTQSINITVGIFVCPAPVFFGVNQVANPTAVPNNAPTSVKKAGRQTPSDVDPGAAGQGDRLVVSWNPALSANPNADIVYDIYRVNKVDPGNGTQEPTFTPTEANRIASGVRGTSFIDTGLVLNQVNYYIVQARDGNCNKLDTADTGNRVARWNAPTVPQVLASPPFPLENFEAATADSRFTPPLTESAGDPNNALPLFQRTTGVTLSGSTTTSTMFAPDFDPPDDGTGAPSDFSTKIGPLALTPTSLMEFDHRFASEAKFDGGVIQICVGDAACNNTAPFPNNITEFDAEPFIIDGQYNDKFDGTIEGVPSSPLLGRLGYTGVKGFHHVRLSLWAFAPGQYRNPSGLPVYVRFRMTSDAGTSLGPNSGWYIDNLVINNMQTPAATLPIRHAVGDFDGDNKTDIAVFRTSEGKWYIINSSDGVTRTQQWGTAGDTLVPRDYDGDGRADIAIWRDGTWYLLQSFTSTVRLQQWGQAGDRPTAAGFYDEDRKTGIAVWRPTDGNWYTVRSTDGTSRVQQWGNPTDLLVPGDYDGDGRTDFAVYRPTEGNWYVVRSSNGTSIVQNWGTTGDKPVPGDYDGDGKTDFAVFRPSEGVWYIRKSGGGTTAQGWGDSTDRPVPGDYDGDGKTDIAVWRPGDGNWYLLPSSTGTGTIRFLGQSGDIPIPSAYIP